MCFYCCYFALLLARRRRDMNRSGTHVHVYPLDMCSAVWWIVAEQSRAEQQQQQKFIASIFTFSFLILIYEREPGK